MSAQNVLIVGGTGFIGANAATHLSGLGHSVTVSSRSPLPAADALPPGATGHLVLDYSHPDDATIGQLEGFDSIVFAAGSDVRHVTADQETEEFWAATQSVGVPTFAEIARRAGVARFVQIGSYYHQVRPDLADTVPYVRARRDADVRTRALTTDAFAAITLNPPSIVGSAPGRVLRRFARMVSWARGELSEPPLFAPPGGTNYLSVRSLSQAIGGALDAGLPGHAYLIGDENLSYREYFQLFADEAGAGVEFVELDDESPFQPDRFLVHGRGGVITLSPDPEETALLGYDRHDIRRAVREIVDAVDVMRAG